MADDIAYDFEVLRGYLKRLTATADGRISGAEASAIAGPSGQYWAVSDFRSTLDAVAREFGTRLDEAGAAFDRTHATIAQALAEAVETDASIADDVKLLMTMLDSLSTPTGGKASGGPITGKSTGTAAGSIG